METVDKQRQIPAKRGVLGIYAKQPVAGQCKTRLSPPLSLVEAAELYRCSLCETIARMQAGSGYDLVICYTGERSWFEQTFPGVALVPQHGADLGLRMAASLHDFLQQGYQQAILIGSDSPDLPLERITQAFSALQQAEVVLGPASDGGYVLIGESAHYPQLFVDIEWSTAEVLTETEHRIEQSGIAAIKLEAWDDLDDLQSLQRFLQRSPETCTAEYLRQHLAGHFSAVD